MDNYELSCNRNVISESHIERRALRECKPPPSRACNLQPEAVVCVSWICRIDPITKEKNYFQKFLYRNLDLNDLNDHNLLSLSRGNYLNTVCLSVAYIGPKSRTERPRKTQIGTEVAHVTRDSGVGTPLSRSKGQRSTCRGLEHIVAASHTACLICCNVLYVLTCDGDGGDDTIMDWIIAL